MSRTTAQAFMTFDTQGCQAIITGASSGLGAEFARQLAPQAVALLLSGRRTDGLEAVAAECLALNPLLTVRTVAADLATEAGRAALVAAVAALPSPPNLLINNAGMGDYGTLASADAARLHQQIELNMTAPVLLTHALLPRLERPAGILNVSSLASTLPMPAMAVYAASKAFVSSFSEALAIELAPERITVSCVCPGPTPTNFSLTARRDGGEDTNREGQGMLRIPPQAVVGQALQGLRAGAPCVYPGLGVRVAARSFRHLPRFLLRRLLQQRHARSIVKPPPSSQA